MCFSTLTGFFWVFLLLFFFPYFYSSPLPSSRQAVFVTPRLIVQRAKMSLILLWSSLFSFLSKVGKKKEKVFLKLSTKLAWCTRRSRKPGWNEFCCLFFLTSTLKADVKSAPQPNCGKSGPGRRENEEASSFFFLFLHLFKHCIFSLYCITYAHTNDPGSLQEKQKILF